jgi:DNA polymerase
MENKAKQVAYAELVKARKACTACAELINPSHACGGKFDSDRLGPYSQWQGNLDAEVLIVAQDFADVATFERVGGWPGEDVRTNRSLVELAKAAGLDIAPPRRGCSEDKLFFTNAVLCLKKGTMGSAIPPRCFRECGRRFLRPTIELIRPRAVVCLGIPALDAVLESFELSRAQGLISLIEAGQTFELLRGITAFPMCHPSPRVRGQRSLDQQNSDWARLGDWLRSSRSANPEHPVAA